MKKERKLYIYTYIKLSESLVNLLRLKRCLTDSELETPALQPPGIHGMGNRRLQAALSTQRLNRINLKRGIGGIENVKS